MLSNQAKLIKLNNWQLNCKIINNVPEVRFLNKNKLFKILVFKIVLDIRY